MQHCIKYYNAFEYLCFLMWQRFSAVPLIYSDVICQNSQYQAGIPLELLLVWCTNRLIGSTDLIRSGISRGQPCRIRQHTNQNLACCAVAHCLELALCLPAQCSCGMSALVALKDLTFQRVTIPLTGDGCCSNASLCFKSWTVCKDKPCRKFPLRSTVHCLGPSVRTHQLI